MLEREPTTKYGMFAYSATVKSPAQVSRPVDKGEFCVVTYCAQNQKEVVPLCNAKP
jgi:hypothetical protein